MHDLPGARRVAGFLLRFSLMALLAGCGGGSGGDEATRTEISTNAIRFSAAGPAATTPTSQVFTATFGSDIAHLAVVHSGSAIVSATSVLNGRTAQITVEPASPASIGSGAFTGAVAVTGYTCADTTCTKLAAGSTSTVSVSYQVSPVAQRVTPYVATSGVSDTVVVRGVGFRSFNITGVRFGDTAATSSSLIDNSTTELRATHPALAAGTYTVHLNATDHQGEIPSTATLVVVDPIAYPATTLAYPAATTVARRLIYDAERRALLVVTDVAGNSIVRYPYANGAWGAPTTSSAGFLDAALSADGAQLYALTPTTLVPVDPVTFALGTAVTAPSLATNSFLKNLVVGNDNRALVTTSLTTSGTTGEYIYDPATAALVLTGVPLNNATPAMSANGAAAVVSQGDPTLTADVAVYTYASSTNALAASAVSLRQNTIAPALDRTPTRIVLNGSRVYDVNFALLGTLPTTTAAVVLNSAGTRAYAYDPTLGGILVYDISVDRDEAAYAALGAVVPLVGDPGSGVQMTITPDNGTLFLAGGGQIVVQPTPAL